MFRVCSAVSTTVPSRGVPRLGDSARDGPKLSPRLRAVLLYDEMSLLCREWPRRRPGGGLERVDEPVDWLNGGDLYRAWVLGGGAASCGPVAFRFLGESTVL